MSYKKLSNQAKRLATNELTCLVAELQQALEQREQNPSSKEEPNDWTKEVVLSSTNPHGFILEELDSLRNGHLYLASEPLGNNLYRYTLFTFNNGICNDVYWLVAGAENCHKGLQSEMEQFFKKV